MLWAENARCGTHRIPCLVCLLGDTVDGCLHLAVRRPCGPNFGKEAARLCQRRIRIAQVADQRVAPFASDVVAADIVGEVAREVVCVREHIRVDISAEGSCGDADKHLASRHQGDEHDSRHEEAHSNASKYTVVAAPTGQSPAPRLPDKVHDRATACKDEDTWQHQDKERDCLGRVGGCVRAVQVAPDLDHILIETAQRYACCHDLLLHVRQLLLYSGRASRRQGSHGVEDLLNV
mmetsp:Transcript_66893/g.186975  ORF Transcript_66893/g.186975 Transcript_66893/m.186975 type:complete len:235 (+) Transcript_66893:407-1111(+)